MERSSKYINLHANFIFSYYGHSFFTVKNENKTFISKKIGHVTKLPVSITLQALFYSCFVSILSLVSAVLFWLLGQCCFYSGNQVSFRYFEIL